MCKSQLCIKHKFFFYMANADQIHFEEEMNITESQQRIHVLQRFVKFYFTYSIVVPIRIKQIFYDST